MLTTVRNGGLDSGTTLSVGSIALAIACSILVAAESARPAGVAILVTGAVAWVLVEFFEWRRVIRQQTWSAREQAEAEPVHVDQPNTWRRRALTHLVTWLQAAALVPLAAFTILLLGVPVALFARGVIELGSWIVGAMR